MRLIPFFLLAFFAVSCASQTLVKKTGDEEMLLQRANLFWQAKQKNDWNAVKEFVDPDLRAEVDPYLDSLKKQRNMSEIISYTIEEVNRAGNRAVVSSRLEVKITHPLLGPPQVIEQKVKDQWLKKGGSWYIELAKPDLAKILRRFMNEEKEVREKEENKEERR
jgi:hypothetical protein